MKQKIIQQGAEAKIILSGNFVVKDRISKSYRISELDKKIRKRRTKSEAKLLTKASEIINSPKPLETKEFDKIKMPYIKGKKLSEHLDDFPLKKQKEICKIIGQEIAKLHDADIIHGDLTTSNMILVEEKDYEIKDNFKKLLFRLKKLNLPIKEYVIFGSAPLAIRGIRDSRDLDLFVSQKIFNKYLKKQGWKLKEFDKNERHIKMLEKEDIELYPNWGPEKWNFKTIRNDSEIIEGLPFAGLKDFIKWKKAYNRNKDKKDIQLIEEYQSKKNKPIVFLIDFGLGYISRKFEDKAVDLHLLKQALEAKHFKNWKELIKEVFNGYKKSKDSKIVFERLKAVEKRGRYKH